MHLKNYLPGMALKNYVRNYEIVHFNFGLETDIPLKPYAPRPETTLCFFPRDPDHVSNFDSSIQTKQPKTLICGQQTLMKMRRPGHDFLLIMVVFQPGVLHRLTSFPLHLLTDIYAPAELFLPGDIRLVNEKLTDCLTYREMIDVVELFLLKLVGNLKKEATGIDDAANKILQHSAFISIDWLAKESCLSLRQFERKFNERMGISPSRLIRITKFDRTVKIKNAHPERDWLSIALACGYYDYQHLVRDYKEFTGMTPTCFFNLDVKAPERIFGLFEEDKVYPL
jgi:AraC-like DNA-binding protein